jgi:hypothetical protein
MRTVAPWSRAVAVRETHGSASRSLPWRRDRAGRVPGPVGAGARTGPVGAGARTRPVSEAAMAGEVGAGAIHVASVRAAPVVSGIPRGRGGGLSHPLRTVAPWKNTRTLTSRHPSQHRSRLRPRCQLLRAEERERSSRCPSTRCPSTTSPTTRSRSRSRPGRGGRSRPTRSRRWRWWGRRRSVARRGHRSRRRTRTTASSTTRPTRGPRGLARCGGRGSRWVGSPPARGRRPRGPCLDRRRDRDPRGGRAAHRLTAAGARGRHRPHRARARPRCGAGRRAPAPHGGPGLRRGRRVARGARRGRHPRGDGRERPSGGRRPAACRGWRARGRGPGEVRVVLRLGPDAAGDLARHRWASALGLPVDRISHTRWRGAPSPDAVEALVRLHDPALAASVAGWRDALLDPPTGDPTPRTSPSEPVASAPRRRRVRRSARVGAGRVASDVLGGS